MDMEFAIALTVLIEQHKRLSIVNKALIAENSGLTPEAGGDSWLKYVESFEGGRAQQNIVILEIQVSSASTVSGHASV